MEYAICTLLWAISESVILTVENTGAFSPDMLKYGKLLTSKPLLRSVFAAAVENCFPASSVLSEVLIICMRNFYYLTI